MRLTYIFHNFKFFLIVVAVLIAVSSLVVSHWLTQDLKREEQNKMEVWAEAMCSLNNADENTDLNLVLKVLNGNHTIPVIVLDSHGNVNTYRNVHLSAANHTDSLRQVAAKAQSMKAEGRVIKIWLNDHGDFIDVCYDESSLLKRLAYYPYIELAVVVLFVVIAIFLLLISKKAEQNKVWVGLSKETAHQLGTPISSLMAWVEMLKETYPDDVLIPEMDKDVKRLQLIAERFSKIGSVPEPKPEHLDEVISHVLSYMDRRTPANVQLHYYPAAHDVTLMLNASLFEWVLENLCKNAVDAMGGKPGSISIRTEEQPKKVVIDVTDTGKGIKKADFKHVFSPGFTTKKRGWGLGLSLAKRIVEEYHHGHIWVKSSEVGVGTTFRIEMRK